MEYFIKFYESGVVKFIQPVPNDDVEFTFQNGDVINVSEKQMFDWIEKSKTENIRLSVYSAQMLCDLS